MLRVYMGEAHMEACCRISGVLDHIIVFAGGGNLRPSTQVDKGGSFPSNRPVWCSKHEIYGLLGMGLRWRFLSVRLRLAFF